MAKANADNLVRTFICLDLPEAIKERLAALQYILSATGAAASWVRPANVHLTLKFLGDVPAATLPLINTAVARAVGSCRPFPVTVRGAGCFPSARNPKVLWVGIEAGSVPLQTLHQAIESELESEGFPREAKRFSPHLTLARIRNPHNARPLAEELIRQGFAAETFTASKVLVMRSELTPRGSVYTPLGVIPFPQPS